MRKKRPYQPPPVILRITEESPPVHQLMERFNRCRGQPVITLKGPREWRWKKRIEIEMILGPLKPLIKEID